jgi:hypothetical protein
MGRKFIQTPRFAGLRAGGTIAQTIAQLPVPRPTGGRARSSQKGRTNATRGSPTSRGDLALARAPLIPAGPVERSADELGLENVIAGALLAGFHLDRKVPEYASDNYQQTMTFYPPQGSNFPGALTVRCKPVVREDIKHCSSLVAHAGRAVGPPLRNQKPNPADQGG